jgi:DNA-binding beta-propeller fold protein YncE
VNKIVVGGYGSSLALTTHKDSNTVAIIDTNSMTVVKTISGFNLPGDIVVTADGQRAYVANADGTIGVIDLIDQVFIGNIDTGNTTLGQLAISTDGKSLYIGAGNRLLMLGQLTLSIYFQGNVIHDIEISPDDQIIYVAHNPTAYWESGSTITIMQADTLQVVDTIRIDDKLRDLVVFSPACDCWQTYLPLVLKQ